jgi:hypothetical protein
VTRQLSESEALLQVRQFIHEHTKHRLETIREDTDLRHDIGIFGDDAVEFFDSFSVRFSVDLRDFDPGEYFEGEGYPDWNWVRRLFGRKAFTKLKQLRVRQLVLSAIAGRWVPEERESPQA